MDDLVDFVDVEENDGARSDEAYAPRIGRRDPAELPFAVRANRSTAASTSAAKRHVGSERRSWIAAGCQVSLILRDRGASAR